MLSGAQFTAHAGGQCTADAGGQCTAHAGRQWVGLGKHLCGAATDFALRCCLPTHEPAQRERLRDQNKPHSSRLQPAPLTHTVSVQSSSGQSAQALGHVTQEHTPARAGPQTRTHPPGPEAQTQGPDVKGKTSAEALLHTHEHPAGPETQAQPLPQALSDLNKQPAPQPQTHAQHANENGRVVFRQLSDSSPAMQQLGEAVGGGGTTPCQHAGPSQHGGPSQHASRCRGVAIAPCCHHRCAWSPLLWPLSPGPLTRNPGFHTPMP